MEELEKMLLARGATVTIHQNNGIVGDDVTTRDVTLTKKGGADAGDGDE